ncbi:lipoprotein-releasing ABC transporter permease subunit LolC [Thorsellia anophelis]|uniref:Lipoprotein-releasing system permease protein n=1 Tax=Thorsellia anophelis DSM 18579 TaxID=1123402 RepID=A0A1I0BM83_9GAMM|nr:lipoprotein-releasing ABC transporter permease subunit LolC [Thorsellia anophelis]SET08129.1 lipoprotein-releasing system permease protein [Thorsellia anophelis DSM 18579]
MYQPVSLFIAFRYLRGRPSDRFARFVSFFSTLGILLGVMSLITVTSVMNGFEREQEKSILQFQPHAVISNSTHPISATELLSSDPKFKPFLNNKTNAKDILRIEPFIQADVVLQSAQNIAPALMIGVLPDQYEPLFDFFYFAEKTDLSAGSYNTVIGSELANNLGVTKGDEIRILVPSVTQFTPMGRIPSQRIFKVVGIFQSNNQVDGTQLLVNRVDASKLMRLKNDEVTGWRLFLDRPLNVSQIDTTLLPESFILTDWRERQGELFQAIKMEKNMMGLLLSLIIAVASFNIVTSLSLIVMEKQGEIAILQTIGLTKLKVLAIFIVQGASSGVLGAILGTLFGFLLASQINNLPIIGSMMGGRELPIVLDFSQILMIMLSAIAIALLSALYPALRASSIMPAQALRYE